jgi:hypothetical protein
MPDKDFSDLLSLTGAPESEILVRNAGLEALLLELDAMESDCSLDR